MNKDARRRLEEKLRAGAGAVPPEGLLNKIKEEIPDPLPRPAAMPDNGWSASQVWKLAAMVLIIAGGVWTGFKLERRLVRPAAPVQIQAQAQPRVGPAPDSSVFTGPVAKAAYISPDVQPSFQFSPDLHVFSQEKARPYLERGVLPPSDAVPSDAWMGLAEDEDFPSHAQGPTLKMEGCPSPFTNDPRVKLLRVEVASPSPDFMVRKPMDLTFVVDLQALRADGTNLNELKTAMEEATRNLKTDDHLGLTLEGSGARVLVEPTPDRDYIMRVLEGLNDRSLPMPPEPPIPPAPPPPAPGRIHAVIRLSPPSTPDEGGEEVRIIQKVEDGSIRTRTIIVEREIRGRAKESKEALEILKAKEQDLRRRGKDLEQILEKLRVNEQELRRRAKDEERTARGLEKRLRDTLQGMMLDENVTVEFDPRTVDGYRLLGTSVVPAVLRGEGARLNGRKVLALYEVRLKAAQATDAPVARVVFRSEEDGRDREAFELARSIHEGDFARAIAQASQQLRKAAFVARFAAAMHSPTGPDSRELKNLQAEAARMAQEASQQQASMRDLLRWVEVAANTPAPPTPPIPPIPPAPPAAPPLGK